MKTVTMYKVEGYELPPMYTEKDTREYAEFMGIDEPGIVETECQVLETGDTVAISKCVGCSPDESGNAAENEWETIVGKYEVVNDEYGYLVDDDGNHIQKMYNDVDCAVFPYKILFIE
jgi:hypothetical protein